MNKELEALEVIGFYPIDYDGKKYTRIKDEFDEEFDIVEKELKALEIIKEKKVDVEQIIENPDWDNVIWYNTSFTGVLCEGWRMLTQEEYNLLREVLLCK